MFDVVNMLQGVWIFIIFIVFNPSAKSIFCPGGIPTKEDEILMGDLGDKATDNGDGFN